MKRMFVLLLLLMMACHAQATIWDGAGTYTLSDGETVGEGILEDTATLNMTGGTIITGLTCRGSATFNMSGGTIGPNGGLHISGSAIANLSGGNIQFLSAGESSMIHLTVSSYTILPPTSSTLDGILTGHWANGIDTFHMGVRAGTLPYIDFTVVPEPASLLLMLIGGSYFVKRK